MPVCQPLPQRPASTATSLRAVTAVTVPDLQGAAHAGRQLRHQHLGRPGLPRSRPDHSLRAAVEHRHPALDQEQHPVDVRYVGNHGTKEIRAFDYNQVVISQLLPAFKQAANNGWLAKTATGSFQRHLQSGDRRAA